MRRLLLILSGAALLWGALVVATGGIQFHLAGVLFRSRDPGRALVAGLVLLLVHATMFRREFRQDIDRLAGLPRPVLPALALVCALVLGGHAIHFGTFTAGGSDPSGYVSQAYGWASGALLRPLPLPISVPWPNGDASLSPLGYSPGRQPHTMAPTYAPGLPLMMAAALVFGACGPFLVVPFCAALMVWLTFVLGRRTGGPWAGVLAAVFVATSPIVLFQSLPPMSDIPAGALWTGAIVSALGGSRRGALATGLWTAAAYLVRPNLPLLPVILFLHLALSSQGLPRRSAEGAKAGRERWIRLALFSVAAAPAPVAIAALYTSWRGSPFNLGFGSAEEIFTIANIVPNLTRYPVWLWQTQSPVVLAALVPFLPRFRGEAFRPAVRLCAAMSVATLGSYLMYFKFEEWWYLRFLLPAIPAVLVLMSTGLVAMGRRLPRPWGHVAVAAVTILLVAYTTRFSNGQGMFGPLTEGERRYADVGAYVHQALPANAVIFTIQHSGSIRYYAGRMTIRWDLIDRDWVVRAPAEMERLGLHPYLVVEDWELPLMRRTFGLTPGVPAPWPLVARLKHPMGVSVLDLSSQPPAYTVPVALELGRAPHCSARQPLTIQRQ